LKPNDPSTSQAKSASADSDWREWIQPYLKPSSAKALIQLANTGPPFLAVMAAILVALHFGCIAVLVLFPAAAVLLVRLFMFQHDCGHGSFFKARWANNCLGFALGVLTLTPYLAWRGDHAVHHATMGNLDRRGIGDVTTLTRPEYLALSWRGRFMYRLYRHPLVLFGVGPIWLFFISNRIPKGDPRRHWKEWVSVLSTDVALAVIFALLAWMLGPVSVLLGWGPVMLLAATIGVWLFYIQHQFEDAYWEPKSRWDYRTAALEGASYYDLPRVLHWMTGNIGFHHIHHLSSRIPNYRLRDCHNANPALQAAPRLTLWGSLKCAHLALWDADRRQMISFRRAREDGRTAQK
jgi:omega-6 fatty acid desaturase (delta-12 desaturase)